MRKVFNYRPISLLSLPGKILEKVVHKNLMVFLEENNLLSQFQYGYKKNMSTTTSVGAITGDILSNKNVGIDTIATFFDFKKAFDTVDHVILLEKFLVKRVY